LIQEPTMRLALCLPAALLLAGPAGAAPADKKDPLPASAAWELGPLRAAFTVVKTEYDAKRMRVKWTLKTREGARTADFVGALGRQPFTFLFYDDKGAEVALVRLRPADFEGVPRERVMKAGTSLVVTLDLPASMPK